MEIRFTNGSYTDSEGRVMLDPTVYKDCLLYTSPSPRDCS